MQMTDVEHIHHSLLGVAANQYLFHDVKLALKITLFTFRREVPAFHMLIVAHHQRGGKAFSE